MTFFRRFTRLSMAAFLIFAVGGCAQHGYFSSTDIQSSPGVTVYGEIDTSIVRTR